MGNLWLPGFFLSSRRRDDWGTQVPITKIPDAINTTTIALIFKV